MSLGGYKFAGSKVERGSSEPFASWATNMHLAKIDAFMRANTVANAGWGLDMEGSSHGTYHDLTLDLGIGYSFNFVTVFKRVNSATSTTWLAIYTLCKATKTGTADPFDSLRRTLINVPLYSSTSVTLGCYSTYFIRIGSSKISYDDSMLNFTATQSGSTPLIPVGNTGTASDYSDSTFYGWYNTEVTWSPIYFGFAIKGCDVIIFSSNNPGSNICVTIASGTAFTNAQDDYNCFILNTQNSGGTGATYYESASRSISSSSMAMQVAACQNDAGATVIPVTVSACPFGSWSGTATNAPYQALSVYGVSTNTSGIFAKGIVKIDLLAINMPTTNNGVLYSTYANGNYLMIAKQTSTTSVLPNKGINEAYFPNNYYASLFVGWDPSNPDITSEDAWTAYNG